MYNEHHSIIVSDHCLERFIRRHGREVATSLSGKEAAIIDRIHREVPSGVCWYDETEHIYYIVYNQLRVYICKLEHGMLTIMTEYAFTKGMKGRLVRFTRVKNPLASVGITG